MKPYSSQLVESLQNWKDLGTNNISRLNKALELYSNAIPVTESEFLQQPRSLLEQVIVAIIATDNISFDKLKKYIYDNVKDEKTKEDLVKLSHDEIDLKRVKNNHEIINKRFNLDSLFKNNNVAFNILNNDLPQIEMIEICKLLDTYSLSIQDKFMLMVEELGYLCNKYTCNREVLSIIIPTVHSYLFSTYPPSTVPDDIISKVADSIVAKLNNSVYIQKNIINDSTINENTKEIYRRIAEFENSGNNTGDNKSIDEIQVLFNDLACNIKDTDSAESITKIILILYYQYFIVSRYASDQTELVLLMYTYIDTIYMVAGSIKFSSILTAIYNKIINFLSCMECMPEEYKNNEAVNAIKKIKTIIEEQQEYDSAKNDYELEDDPYDRNDNPTGIFTDYDNALMDDIEEVYTIAQSNYLDESTIKTFTNKDVLIKADKDLLNFIEESFEKHYPLISKTKLLTSLNEAVKEVRKDKCTADNMTKITNLKEIISKIKNYHDENQDDMKDPDLISDKNVLAANIIPIKDYNQNKMKTYTAEAVSKYYNEDTILDNNIAREVMNEMKLSSYLTLSLDRLKKGISTLSDAQKAATMNIDRFADTIERLNTEDDRREARMQVVKNSFLPSMSRCIKSIILAGALSVIVNPFLGLVSLVVRFVNSKRAVKEERQAVADEIEVELEMIDRKIRDAEENKDYKKERKLRLLKRKLITYLAKLEVNNKTKWNSEIMFKKDIDDAGSGLGLKSDD